MNRRNAHDLSSLTVGPNRTGSRARDHLPQSNTLTCGTAAAENAFNPRWNPFQWRSRPMLMNLTEAARVTGTDTQGLIGGTVESHGAKELHTSRSDREKPGSRFLSDRQCQGSSSRRSAHTPDSIHQSVGHGPGGIHRRGRARGNHVGMLPGLSLRPLRAPR